MVTFHLGTYASFYGREKIPMPNSRFLERKMSISYYITANSHERSSAAHVPTMIISKNVLCDTNRENLATCLCVCLKNITLYKSFGINFNRPEKRSFSNYEYFVKFPTPRISKLLHLHDVLRMENRISEYVLILFSFPSKKWFTWLHFTHTIFEEVEMLLSNANFRCSVRCGTLVHSESIIFPTKPHIYRTLHVRILFVRIVHKMQLWGWSNNVNCVSADWIWHRCKHLQSDVITKLWMKKLSITIYLIKAKRKSIKKKNFPLTNFYTGLCYMVSTEEK